MTRRKIIFSLLAVACLASGVAVYMAATPAEPPLSQFVPSGALLYLQAADFSVLLNQWNSSAEKKRWIVSANYEMFSRSRLFLRLKGASDQFATAAGLPADANFLAQIAGKQSVIALYDIGKLQFLYITRLAPANSTQSALWQTRAKFETRNAGGVTFYIRRDPESEREVAFAVSGDYLLLATREDLLAGALQLIAGSQDRNIEADSWWSQPVAAAGSAGDLRLVLNLEKIVPSSYFRTYWVQQNITDMKQYNAAVSDMFLSGSEYREERVLLRKTATSGAPENAKAVADLSSLMPGEAGFSEAKENPSPEVAFALLEAEILAPHLGAAPESQIAPQVQLTGGETGAAADLETRIDQAPTRKESNDRSTEIKTLFEKNHVLAIAQAQSSERDQDGVFVRMYSAVAMAASTPWNEDDVRTALTNFVRPALTASELGVGWQQKPGYDVLDGLWPLCVVVRGKYLIVADDPHLLSAILARTDRKVENKPAIFVAEFRHDHERENFARLTGVVDRPGMQFGAGDRTPQFMSGNIASLSSTLSGVSSENIVVRDAGDKVFEIVIYKWSQ